MSELVEKVRGIIETHIAACEPPDAIARAAIAAVVRALRDETEMRSCACRFWLDEILGDAGEKVGTHGTPELDEDARKLEAMGQDPGAVSWRTPDEKALDADLLREDAHERKRLESEYPWKE